MLMKTQPPWWMSQPGHPPFGGCSAGVEQSATTDQGRLIIVVFSTADIVPSVSPSYDCWTFLNWLREPCSSFFNVYKLCARPHDMPMPLYTAAQLQPIHTLHLRRPAHLAPWIFIINRHRLALVMITVSSILGM